MSIKTKVNPYMTEKDLLKQCTDYLDILVSQGILYYACVTDSAERKRDKGSCPDLVIWLLSKSFNLFIITAELKTPKGTGRLTRRQKEFVDFIKRAVCHRYIHLITNKFETLQTVIENAREDYE